jgi:DNA replication ATP-dependent helicase Dna2
MQQQPVNHNVNNVNNSTQQQQQPANTGMPIYNHHPPAPAAGGGSSGAGPSRAQPAVDKHLAKVAEIDLLENIIPSQIEWQDSGEDNIRALWKSPGGSDSGIGGNGNHVQNNGQLQRTAASKQRLLQGQAAQARPLAASGSGSPGDEVLEEVLAGLNDPSAAAGAGNYRRRISNGSPASEISNRGAGAAGVGQYRTPATVHRRPGIIKNATTLARLNRLQCGGRNTPTSVAFEAGLGGGYDGHVGSGLGNGVTRPRFGPIGNGGGVHGAAGDGNVGKSTGKKRRHTQFCQVLDNINSFLDKGGVDDTCDGMEAAERVGGAGCNDIVGPSSRIAAVTTNAAAAAAVVGSPPPAAPPSQRPRYTTATTITTTGQQQQQQQQQDKEQHGLADGVMKEMNILFENWQSPTKQDQRQQEQQQIDDGNNNNNIFDAAAAPSPLDRVMLAPTQPQPAAMEAPPPSPYIHQTQPRHSRAAAQANLEAIQRNKIQFATTSSSKVKDAEAEDKDDLWGSDSDDSDDAVILEAAACGQCVPPATYANNSNQQPAVSDFPPPASSSTPSSSSSSLSKKAPILAGDRALVHFTIVTVWPDCPSFDGSLEIQLQLHNPYSGLQVIAHVQYPYNHDIVYLPNDPVNLMVPKVDNFNGQYHCIIGGSLGHPRTMLVHYPDVLLGGTRVAGSTQCPRQGFLQERIAGGDGTNAACTKGTMYHSLFQLALSKGLRQANQLEDHAHEIVSSSPVTLLDSNMTEHQAFSYLKGSIPKMIGMLNKFQRETPLENAILSAGHVNGVEVKRAVAIPEVLDIEEYIAAPKFGLKGYVDASIKLKLLPVDPQQNNTTHVAGEVVVAPLELKTGFKRISDEAQVLLYLLAMEERYGKPLNWGLLVNSNPKTDEPQRLVARQDQHLATLMAARNRLASALARASLPELVDEKSSCNRCFARTECMLTHAAIENPNAVAGNSSFVDGMMDGRDRDTLEAIYQSETAHLTPKDKEFLRHWAALLDLEASRATKQRPEIWAMTGHAREAAGRCVTGLTIIRAVKNEASSSVMYTFARRGGGGVPSPFPPGEILMLGVDGRHAGVGRGHLYESTPETLTVIMDKELREGLLFPQGKLAAMGIGARTQSGVVCCDPSVAWRLDKEEVVTTTPRIRGFLYSLFARSFDRDGKEDPVSARATRLRKFIVDLEAPAAVAAASITTTGEQKLIQAVDNEARLLNLNKEQHHAVRCAALCNDYALVLGMPGAGKTTAIVAMVRSLARVGKRVLLTSYTNSAVDNVLLKLAEIAGKEDFIPFVRVGREGRINPTLVDFTPSGAQHKATTAGELASLVDRVKIWGVSALGATDALIRRREFDVVIVDEAGQITLPSTIGPLLRGNTFVLVGDPHQLPPLVTNEEAVEKGLAEPLFARLAAAHPSAVVTLPVQYRMAEEIQVLPNLLSYNGEMRCASDAVAEQMLQFPRWASLTGAIANNNINSVASLPTSSQQKMGPAPSWLVQVLEPVRRVVFLDTSSMPAPEVKIGEAVTNPSEADIILSLVTAAVRAGLPAHAIGLISPYNRQVSLLDKLTRSAGVGATECLTIDKAQGRDKKCVIVSLVKSNVEKETGKLLTDLRRVNVAITRARAKLILIGDASTLKVLPLFEKVLRECEKRKWIISVPAGALEK